ncbi:U3 small nucleolar RNA-interacting protein 2 [Leguminivora glycinivorella]|uniref:U3 small nucleolar RNA-interacting protein 2 n=1 Tax=Leguminivora glycinivorella TaxID=1035111 RepID=UPI002010C663|nr:U3 small nucleolar RNA-interacting protein 2 [Leguminivora glycinivorella]
MSSSFFLKGKSRQVHKRKGEKIKKVKPKRQDVPNLENGHDSSGSDVDFKKFSDAEESESDHETAEQKKLRLAKKYLEEIEKEEAKRAELKEVDDDAIGKRLQRDYLEQKGKLRVEVADNYVAPAQSDIRLIRAREHKLPLTCVCVSSDGQFAFTGSKCGTIVKWGIKEKRKLGSLTFKTHSKYIHGCVSAVVLSSDTKYLASSDETKDVQIWDPITLKHVHTFRGHKDKVTGLVFRKNTHELYSASKDRSIKIWSLDEMAYVETLFGHQSSITSIDALTRERAISAGGRDASVRIWKIVEESQLIFNGPVGSLDEVKLLDEEHFVSGSDNGSLCVWSVLKKKPLCTVTEAHGSENNVPRWITSLATLLNSDVFASGSYDNFIRLWKVSDAYRKVSPMFSIEINGFVNSMHFTSDGTQLYAAIGQEHKSGRWFKVGSAKNGVLVINFNIKS